VQPQKLYTFVAAARAFLKNPNLNFFYPPRTIALTVKELRQELERRGSAIIFLTFKKVEAVPDVLWGQIYKSQRSLHKLVQLNDFKILRDLSWSDGKTVNMFIFELEHCCLSSVRKHSGPPLDKEKECEKFIMKYLDNPDVVCGPYVEDGRWVVLVMRKFTDACELLKERLKDGGRNAGVAEGISKILKGDFEVLVNEEIIDLYRRNAEFADFLTEFLLGTPKWLEDIER
jgi:tRNA nucleotidyltransferase (CCA-adding enzyme)